MKKILCILSAAAILSSSVALAVPTTIDLEEMTPSELRTLQEQVKDEYDRATEFSSNDYNLLVSNFKEAFETLVPSDATVSYPFFGFDKSRGRCMYKLSGECTIKFPDKSKKSMDMSMIYWHDEENQTFRQVAFYSKEKIYYCDNELLAHVDEYLDESTLAFLGAEEITYTAQEVRVTPSPTNTPTPDPTALPVEMEPETSSPTQEPISPELQITNAIENALDDRYIKHEINNLGDNINVYFELGGGWSASSYKTGFFMDCKKIIKGLHELSESGVLSYKTLYLEADTSFLDVYGNSTYEKAMTLDITQENVAKINWDRFDYKNLEQVAEYFWCHPAIEKE